HLALPARKETKRTKRTKTISHMKKTKSLTRRPRPSLLQRLLTVSVCWTSIKPWVHSSSKQRPQGEQGERSSLLQAQAGPRSPPLRLLLPLLSRSTAMGATRTALRERQDRRRRKRRRNM